MNGIYYAFLFCVWLGFCLAIPNEFCPTVNGTRVKLSNRHLADIPDNIPVDVVYLNISSNILSVLRNGSLSRLTQLVSLDASQNQITKLESKAFSAVTKLCYLNLQGNKLTLTYQTYPERLFLPIQQLKVLLLENNTVNTDYNTVNGNDHTGNADYNSANDNYHTLNADYNTANANYHTGNADYNTANADNNIIDSTSTDTPKDYSYPDRIFKYLPYLRELHIDGQNRTVFGEGFQLLASLEELYLLGQINSIANETFHAFTNLSLKSLLIQSDIFNYTVDAGALSPLKKLRSLTIQGYIGIDKGLRSLYGIRNNIMTSVTLSGLNSHEPGQIALSNYDLTEEKLQYLASICTAVIDLSNNRITSVQRGALINFKHSHCLEELHVGHNWFSIHTSVLTFYELSRFINLRYVDVSGASPLKGTGQAPVPRDVGEIEIFIPPYLEVLHASYAISEHTSFSGSVKLKNAGNIRELDLSYGGIEGCFYTFYGLEALKTLNISGCNCYVINPNVFDHFPALETLVMRSINLNTGLKSDPDGKLFGQLTDLVTLDISDNGLTWIHENLLSALENLENLNMADNKLLSLPKAVMKLTSLKMLNLSFNAMTYLDDSCRKWLDSISPQVTLFVRGNPWTCTCQTVEFLRWILETRVTISERDNLTCLLGNGTMVTFNSLRKTVRNFEVTCISNFWLIFSITSACVIIILLILAFVAYRKRWNIKFWILTKFKSRQVHEPIDPQRYEYDAFVAYNHGDYRWVVFELRQFLEDGDQQYSLCLHHRDFPAGESIQQNIADAITSSKKIIIVVSRKYLQCDWAEFEIRMAGMRMVQEGRENVIIVIMLEDIPVREMPRSLLSMYRSLTFLLWSRDPLDERLFWSRLSEAMQR